jgi:hypothetical protein
MPPRSSIARLVALVALCGVAFAALRSPSQLWASALFALALGSLPVALIHVLYLRGRRRAFWAGFLICGSAYFAASLGPWFRDEFGPRMVTTALLDLLYVQVSPPATAPNNGWTAGTAAAPPPTSGWSGANAGGPVTISGGPGMTAAVLAQVVAGSPPAAPTTRWDAWTVPDRADGVGYQVGQLALASTAPFRRIGHSLLTLLIAALGGCYARYRFAAEGGGGG